LSTPALVGAAEEAAKVFKFAPTKSTSTFGLIYTVAMVVVFFYVGYLSQKKTASSDDYYTADRGIGALSNGLAMTSNFLSLATFLGFTALIWKLQFLLVAFVMAWIGALPIAGAMAAGLSTIAGLLCPRYIGYDGLVNDALQIMIKFIFVCIK